MIYHFIGIGGIGMSGLARILLQRGCKVQGSDAATSYVTDGLQEAGATIFIGHAKEHLPNDATVIYNSDIPATNPELIAAKERSLPLLHRSDLLVKLMSEHKVLAVTGTHGKTTTSSLLAHVFCSSGKDPAFAVGGLLLGKELNAAHGTSPYFIAEADESDGTFLKYTCEGAIVTNIDNDHLAHFGSWDNLVDSFKTFTSRCSKPEYLFYCADDATLRSMNIKGTSYGFSEGVDLHIENFHQNGLQIEFDIRTKTALYQNITCNLSGRHNALNATAVFGLSLALGVTEAEIRKALISFAGVKRRLEMKGEANGITAFDDYAHHPSEIKATLKGLRAAVGDRSIVAVFQPHRYSRMRYVMKDFDHVFDDADIVVVTDLFTAREAAVEGVSTEAILEEIKKTAPNCIYMPRDTLVEQLASSVPSSSVVITMGAGDITKVGKELLTHVQRV
ncbi:MAG: UDP-N-acetylmuramate--L-alanine ligase [Verrucomicrobia bacterium]|nr:UDP-N-acetylmuramate--L-alanine ligase [Verrucomicrobiota bacterium]MBS0636548.1 UDP-N-acetylmuramate--L-alanine ligase [Verrucomicrobiota bacterium]